MQRQLVLAFLIGPFHSTAAGLADEARWKIGAILTGMKERRGVCVVLRYPVGIGERAHRGTGDHAVWAGRRAPVLYVVSFAF
jgi:hypothetical protein